MKTFKLSVQRARRLWAAMTPADKGSLRFCDIVGHIHRQKRKRRKRCKSRAVLLAPAQASAKPVKAEPVSYGWDKPGEPYKNAFSECQRRPHYKTRCRMKNVNTFRGYKPECQTIVTV